VVQLLLDASADIEHVNKDGDNAIIFAAYHNHPEAVDVLIKVGTNVNYIRSCDRLSKLSLHRC